MAGNLTWHKGFKTFWVSYDIWDQFTNNLAEAHIMPHPFASKMFQTHGNLTWSKGFKTFWVSYDIWDQFTINLAEVHIMRHIFASKMFQSH